MSLLLTIFFGISFFETIFYVFLLYSPYPPDFVWNFSSPVVPQNFAFNYSFKFQNAKLLTTSGMFNFFIFLVNQISQIVAFAIWAFVSHFEGFGQKKLNSKKKRTKSSYNSWHFFDLSLYFFNYCTNLAWICIFGYHSSCITCTIELQTRVTPWTALISVENSKVNFFPLSHQPTDPTLV